MDPCFININLNFPVQTPAQKFDIHMLEVREHLQICLQHWHGHMFPLETFSFVYLYYLYHERHLALCNFITSAVMFLQTLVCLSVCLSVSNIV